MKRVPDKNLDHMGNTDATGDEGPLNDVKFNKNPKIKLRRKGAGANKAAAPLPAFNFKAGQAKTEEKKAESAAPAPGSALAKLLAKKNSQWSCPTCMIRNDNSIAVSSV